MKWLWGLGLALVLAGCGSGIGDGCTTDQDCGGRRCDTFATYPGGYCTQRCTPGDDSTCPAGGSCQVHQGEILCLRTCKEDVECRSGYRCLPLLGVSGTTFCLAPGDG